MRSGFRRVFYLLTMIALIISSSSCSLAKKISPSNTNATPVVLTVTLDDTASVSALIPQKGGEVSVTLANGLVYTVNIPEGALLSDQEVTLTPIRSIEGLPFSGGLIGGVQLEPDGTILMAPATLTIQIPKGYDKRTLVGFVYHGIGTGFHLASASGDGSTITLEILSFSGHGAASGTDQEVHSQAARSTGSAADDLDQQKVDILNGARDRDGKVTDSEMKKLVEVWKDYYDKVVKPALQVAVSDDSKIDAASHLFIYWGQQAALLGMMDEMDSRYTEGSALMIKGLKNAFDKAAQRCVSNQDINESDKMITRLYQINFLIGDSDPSYTFTGKFKEFERCLRYRVNFESIITATTAMDQQIVSHVVSTVILKLDPENYSMFSVYRGTGDLKFKEYTSEWIGESAGMNAVCKITNLTTKDGGMRMLSNFGWSNLNSPKPKFNISLGVKPSGLEQGFPNFNCDTGSGTIQTNVNVNQSMWSASFDKLHSDIKGTFLDLNDAYFFSEFAISGGKLLARLTQNKTETASAGKLEEVLTIDIFGAPGAN